MSTPAQTVYDVDYFIAKFEAIPEEKWCVAEFTIGDGCCCALGHCGMRNRSIFSQHSEAVALAKLFGSQSRFGSAVVTCINDGHDPRYPQSTPKARILAALHNIKAKQEAKQ